MLTLYSYPELFGVADNNGYGLKVFAFLSSPASRSSTSTSSTPRSAARASFPISSTTARRSATARPSSPIVIRQYRLTHRCRAHPGAAHHESSGHAHARRSLLGDVVFALEGRPLLAGVSRRAAARASAARRTRALTRRKEYNAQRYHFQGIGRYPAGRRLWRAASPICRCSPICFRRGLCPWREAHQHRCRHLRLHRQHPLLPRFDTPLKRSSSRIHNLVRHCDAIHAASR